MVVEKVIEVLKRNGVVLMPSDTVPGLFARFNKSGMAALRKVKKRPEENPFLVVVPNREALTKLVSNINDNENKLIDEHWPGPLTIVFDKHADVSSELTSGKDTVAVRYPEKELLNEVLNELNEPLFSTSANVSGDIVPERVTDVDDIIKMAVDMVVVDPEEPEDQVSSTIVRCDRYDVKVLRQGIITV